jgi:putative DNA primase/helicase
MLTEGAIIGIGAGNAVLLRLRACRWAFQHLAKLRKADPEIPDCLYNRNQDNWRPLLAVADAADGHWRETARAIAETLSGESEDPSEGVMLLADIRRIFDKQSPDRLSTQELLAALREDEDRPWHDYREEGFGITDKQLARLLKLFAIHPNSVRIQGKGTPKGYMRAWFQDAFDRYLPPDSADPSPAATAATTTDISGLDEGEPATITATGGATDPQ